MNLNNIRRILSNEILGGMLQKLTQNAKEGSVLYRMAPMPELYTSGNSIREITRGGIQYRLDLSDLMDWWFYWGFKDVSHNFLLSKVNKNDLVVDVGANKCVLTTLLSIRVDSAGKVYSFEANPENYEVCKELIARNSPKLENCELIGKGCGAETNVMRIARTSSNNTGMDRLVSIDTDNNSGQDVEVVLLDDELKNLDRIDLIKIDTEGFEFEVLKGASAILEKYKPKLFVELDASNLERYATNVEQILEYLKPFGYSFLNIQSDKYFKSESELGSDFHFDCYCEV